ncbi:hypothetical protein ACFVW1_45570 [Streptomyces olivochromogenes]|uniref:hypothetical protein n=1 Tax=Streptomyces olivochromogenes TaxID=1963 RepID=UPI0036DDA27D
MTSPWMSVSCRAVPSVALVMVSRSLLLPWTLRVMVGAVSWIQSVAGKASPPGDTGRHRRAGRDATRRTLRYRKVRRYRRRLRL